MKGVASVNINHLILSKLVFVLQSIIARHSRRELMVGSYDI